MTRSPHRMAGVRPSGPPATEAHSCTTSSTASTTTPTRCAPAQTRSLIGPSPATLPHLRVLLKTVFPEDATPAVEPPEPVALFADPKDGPIRAAALAQQCRYLVTLSQKDFSPPPERILVVGPGDLLRLLRAQLAGL